MKKWLTFVLAMLMLLSLAACAGEEPYVPDDPDYTLESLAGFWTKPEDFDGITVLYTFSVDAASGSLTAYDAYGNVLESYECRYDGSGFSVDMGDELFGVVTYLFDGESLLDEMGEVHYVRCEPVEPDDAPFSLEELQGAWLQDGEDLRVLCLEESDYRWEVMGYDLGGGPAEVIKSTTYYDASEYSGPSLSIEDADGFDCKLWILEGGHVLYDDFHKEYYVRESLSEEERTAIAARIALIRDDWYTTGEESRILVFSFFGELWLYTPNGNGTNACEIIGSWEIEDGTVLLHYAAGGTRELDLYADEVYIDGVALPFGRHEAR